MSPPQVQTLDPPELARRLQAGDVLLVDVREPSEFATERIAGATSASHHAAISFRCARPRKVRPPSKLVST